MGAGDQAGDRGVAGEVGVVRPMSDDIFEVKFTINEREFAFPMTFDQKSPADADMAYWCRQAGACEA